MRRTVLTRPAVIMAVLGALLTACSSGSTSGSDGAASVATGLAGGAGETGAASSAGPTVSATSTPTSPQPTGTAGVEAVAAACPYVGTQAAAEAEGNRIGQVTTLNQDGVVIGCRFQFAYGDHHDTIEITTQRFGDDVTAHNAMVTQGSAGEQAGGITLASGEQGITYRTAFYAPDNGRDWACVFAKGTVVVTIKTDQTDTSLDAVNLANLVVPTIS